MRQTVCGDSGLLGRSLHCQHRHGFVHRWLELESIQKAGGRDAICKAPPCDLCIAVLALEAWAAQAHEPCHENNAPVIAGARIWGTCMWSRAFGRVGLWGWGWVGER